jgi:hypothetical protein
MPKTVDDVLALEDSYRQRRKVQLEKLEEYYRRREAKLTVSLSFFQGGDDAVRIADFITEHLDSVAECGEKDALYQFHYTPVSLGVGWFGESFGVNTDHRGVLHVVKRLLDTAGYGCIIGEGSPYYEGTTVYFMDLEPVADNTHPDAPLDWYLTVGFGKTARAPPGDLGC